MRTIISGYQATLLLIVTMVATSIIFLPSTIIGSAFQDAWISVLVLMGGSLLFSYVLVALCKRMGRTDLITFTRKVFGKFLTIPVGFSIVIAFVILSGVVTRETSEILANAYYPLTPIWFINLIIIITASILVYYGLEAMARSLEVIFYIYILFFLILIISLIKDMSIGFLRPILANGFKPVFEGAFLGLVFFSEIFVILILAPHIRGNRRISRFLILAIIISGIIFIILILTLLMLFGPEVVNKLTVSLITANGYVEIFRVIAGLDSLFIFYWIGGGIFKAAFFIYVSVYVAQKIFNKPNYYIFIPPVIPVVFYFSFYYFQNIAKLLAFMKETLYGFLLVLVIYPVVLLLISLWRGISCSEDKI